MANKFDKFLEEKEVTIESPVKPTKSAAPVSHKEKAAAKTTGPVKYRSLRVNERTYQLLSELKYHAGVPLLRLFDEAVEDLYQKRLNK